MARRLPFVWIALFGFLGLQIGYSWVLLPLRPAFEEIPFPLSDVGLKGIALGDEQFLFRFLARWLQDVGDGGGRLRPLRDYDYDRVVGWLKSLDRLDDQSEYGHELAARYFGALTDPTSGPVRVGKIAAYFRELALADPARHWRWLVWAATRAHRFVKDRDLSERIANDLIGLRDNDQVPVWLPLLASPLYRFAGDLKAAQALESDPTMIERRRQGLNELGRSLGWPELP